MNYDEQIESAQNEIDSLQIKILGLMEKKAGESIDLKAGDKVTIRRTDAIAIVDECYAKGYKLDGDCYVKTVVKCRTRSGLQHVLHRCEVEKIQP